MFGLFVVLASFMGGDAPRERLRAEKHPGWRAGRRSTLPFVSVHLVLFFSMPWPIAVASLVLAIVVSFPLAHLFELGGNTIWAPALLHFVIQATVKVVVSSHGSEAFALAWIAASAIVPLLVFAFKARAPR